MRRSKRLDLAAGPVDLDRLDRDRGTEPEVDTRVAGGQERSAGQHIRALPQPVRNAVNRGAYSVARHARGTGQAQLHPVAGRGRDVP